MSDLPNASQSIRSNSLSARISVVGAGVAGAAIAYELNRIGQQVTLITPDVAEGSSYTNQKWLHSGALYPIRTLAQEMWKQFKNVRPEIRRHVVSRENSARFVAIHPETIDRQVRNWQELATNSWFKWDRLSRDEYSSIGSIGRTNANAGLSAPDKVIDFPALIQELVASLPPERRLENQNRN